MKQRYPLATIAEYGPDASRATKLVVSVLLNERSTDPSVMRTWTTEDGDVREDPVVAREVADLLQHHQVRDSVRTERIIGCPHEEGIDYPMGRVCPRCPFWTTIDRFTHERIAPPVASLTVDQILDELSRERPAPSAEALESADALREALVAPLLSALEHGVAQPDDASVEDGMRFSYALYLFAKWREPRAYPRVIAWLSLPGESAFAIGGDIATQDGSRILAAVCDGDLGPIVRLAANPDANEYCRGAAIEALGLLAAWAEVPRETVIAHLATLEREGLERVPGQIWVAFASTVADIAAVELRSVAERAFDEDLIDPFDMRRSELNAVPWEDPARALESRRDEWLPIDDVAAATLWWAVREPLRAHTEVERLRSNKVGRNEPCPCGSGKKYKKCCGG